jgi:3-dehydroquinate dehydratase/shikimate dehydrogenase
MSELRRRRDDVASADLVELRLDSVADPDPAGALEGRRHPVIVTCRARWEGGQFAGAEEERFRLLRDAQRLGAEYVDVEWKANFTELIHAHDGKGVVLSMHDFNGVPSDLAAQASAMGRVGAEVVKIAVMADKLSDCLRLLALSDCTPARVLLAMGDSGLPSRVLATRFGSCWTYAGDAVAPGQVPAERLVNEFAFDRISRATALYGVVGKPIMHSVSPAMHNAAFKATRMDAVYLPLAAHDYADFLTFADAMSIEGVSVTAPFKLDAFKHSSAADPVSRRTESANTLRRHDGAWQARNTDVAGFLAPLSTAIELRGARVTILGAGGAARAAADALVSAGAATSIAARRRPQAAAVAQLSGATAVDWPPPAGSWDVLVNTTPVGTAPAEHDSPLPDGPFTGDLVYDLVYNPPDTRLLRDARAAGCRTIGGLAMLVAQAQLQFEWWTGARPPASVMHNAARRALGTL